ncbi:MAG: HNH endonuclease [Deltaproteobacteria bacterium]|nr:HNH endonuclease [Deltaproteobacteria bacterium]
MGETDSFEIRQSRDVRCAFCDTLLDTSNSSREHVIPNALGGHKTVNNFICVTCNSSSGATWDNDLVKQLAPLCTMLNVKRHRGINRPLLVETVEQKKILLYPDGVRTIGDPVYTERTTGNRTEISVRARSLKEAKKMVAGIKRKYPQVDIEGILQNAKAVQEDSHDVWSIPLSFGGLSAGRSVVKTCLALAYETGLDIDDCEHAKRYLLSSGEPCFGYYYDQHDLVKNRPPKTALHCVYLQGDPIRKQLLGYVEYFGCLRLVVCLSSDYVGTAFSRGYALDPITGDDLDVQIDLDMGPEDIRAIYAYQKVDYDVARQAMGALLAMWKEKDEQSAMSRAFDNAWKAACTKCGVAAGEVFSEERAAELAGVLTNELTPFLLHLLRSRVFDPEDLEKIVRKLEEGGADAG